jgi:4-hydroxy-tetrahydrodipicolinate synthase
MVLPPYVYSTDEREMQAHVSAVIDATRLPCMLYNNPPAYKTDFTPPQIVRLAERHANLAAVKESSGDVRRITALRALAVDRLAIAIGVDDLVVEAVAAGAVAWVAGLVNAFPRESVSLFELARRGDHYRATEIYRWMLPLLRMDTVPKFVQLIKLAQQEAGIGSERVRAPRLPLEGRERDEALALIRERLARRPRP